MTQLFHLNCGTLQRAGGPKIICHCLLLKQGDALALVDTGIGLQDVLHPQERIGTKFIELYGFQFHQENTAYHQIKKLGLEPLQVEHCILTHLDADHTGGLADFPRSTVHVSEKELDSFRQGNPRYLTAQLSHRPNLKGYADFTQNWFGFPAAPLELGFESRVLLVALPGHTLGHCGVAVQHQAGWVLHAGDAYYIREELFVDNHPATEVSKVSAVDQAAQARTVIQLKELLREQGGQVQVFGYHDPTEFPGQT